MGYLLDIASKVKTPQKKSTSCYELNELNEAASYIAADIPSSTDRCSRNLKVDPSPTESVTTTANANAAWPPEIQSIIDWFLTMEPPTKPFYLQNHMHVADPLKYFQTIRREIETGPRGPRARFGTLQSDLRKLKSYYSEG